MPYLKVAESMTAIEADAFNWFAVLITFDDDDPIPAPTTATTWEARVFTHVGNERPEWIYKDAGLAAIGNQVGQYVRFRAKPPTNPNVSSPSQLPTPPNGRPQEIEIDIILRRTITLVTGQVVIQVAESLTNIALLYSSADREPSSWE